MDSVTSEFYLSFNIGPFGVRVPRLSHHKVLLTTWPSPGCALLVECASAPASYTASGGDALLEAQLCV
jgi:hypothetical protein